MEIAHGLLSDVCVYLLIMVEADRNDKFQRCPTCRIFKEENGECCKFFLAWLNDEHNSQYIAAPRAMKTFEYLGLFGNSDQKFRNEEDFIVHMLM